MKPAFKRILLKLSGEALMGDQNYGIDTKVAEKVAQELKEVHALGVEVAIVVGGGNIFRGVSKSAGNMDRAAADYIGMLATVMNAVVLQDALEKLNVFTRVLSAIDILRKIETRVVDCPGFRTELKPEVIAFDDVAVTIQNNIASSGRRIRTVFVINTVCTYG